MVIKVENLSIARGGRIVLSDLNFAAKPGMAVRLLGPNGSGKTTLMRCLAGLLPPYSGSVACDQSDVVFSSHLDAVKLQMTVEENLAFWASIYGQNLDPAKLAPLDLNTIWKKHAKDLSAGQKRRVGLARVLLSNANIWLLDEPLNSLDAGVVKNVERAIAAHRKNGGIVILSSHQDVSLPKAKILEMVRFAPKASQSSDPFLEGVI